MTKYLHSHTAKKIVKETPITEVITCMKRTSFNKGVFLGPEYLNNILGTNSHIKGTCIVANFESNGPLVWCLLSVKSGWGNSIPVLPEVIN